MIDKKKILNELKRATLAAYIQKAAPRIGSSTSLSKSFYDDAGTPLRLANKHSKYVFDPKDPEGKNKSPELAKKYGDEYDAAMKLSGRFARQARNRIKGVQKAAAKLAKEETLVEGKKNPYGSGFKLIHRSTGKQFKVGDKFKDERDTHTILGWQHGSQRGNPASSGRIRTRISGKHGWEQEYFPHVFDMEVVKESDSNIQWLTKDKWASKLNRKTEE